MRVQRTGVYVALIVSALLGTAGIVWRRWYGAMALHATQHGLRRLESLPADPGDFAGIELAGADLRELNLRDKGPLLLAEADFDSLTAWPIAPWRRPSGFDPEAVLEEGKDPGLGLRAVHRRGITGAGVAIAVIDQDLLVDHIEYADRLRLYEEVDAWGSPQVHGAVASIAAGATVGVAPGADVYYFVVRMDRDRKCANVARAIARVLDLNESLPEDARIRVIATSCSWRPGEPGYEAADRAVRSAKAKGLFVVSTVVDRYYNFSFHGLGRAPGNDPDEPRSYVPGAWWAKEFETWYPPGESPSRVLVPMDSRTVSSPFGKDVYAFYRVGGWSWCVPYIAGVFALALQVRGDLTVDEFARAAVDTGHHTQIAMNGRVVDFGPILNPAGLLERLASTHRP